VKIGTLLFCLFIFWAGLYVAYHMGKAGILF